MSFTPSEAESDISLCDCGDHYEYLARYVDDFAIISKQPQKVIDALEKEHEFKLLHTTLGLTSSVTAKEFCVWLPRSTLTGCQTYI